MKIFFIFEFNKTATAAPKYRIRKTATAAFKTEFSKIRRLQSHLSTEFGKTAIAASKTEFGKIRRLQQHLSTEFEKMATTTSKTEFGKIRRLQPHLSTEKNGYSHTYDRIRQIRRLQSHLRTEFGNQYFCYVMCLKIHHWSWTMGLHSLLRSAFPLIKEKSIYMYSDKGVDND